MKKISFLAAIVALLALPACGSEGSSSNSNDTALQSTESLKAYDLDTMIAISVGQHGWEQTINDFTGKLVEFRYFPDRYEGDMGNRVLASSNSAVTCPLDESTFLAVQSRKSRFIVIRGVITPFSLDTPLKLDDCEVVKMDTEGWKPDPFEGQDSPKTPNTSQSTASQVPQSGGNEGALITKEAADPRRFDSYRIEVFGGGETAAPILTGGNPPNRDYKSAINEAVMGDPVYAGSYSVVRLGCGNACEFIKFVNQKNGVVVDLPSELEPNPHDIAHMDDSRLLKVTTYLDPDSKNCRYDDLVIENDQFRSIGNRFSPCPKS